jgi:hypothetical protein
MIQATKTYLSGVSNDYLLVSAMSRGFRDLKKPPLMLDLIDLSLTAGDSEKGSVLAVAEVHDAFAQDKPVYYLSSHFEQGSDFQGGEGRDAFGRYFERFNDEFELTPVYVSEAYRTKEHLWILYRVRELSRPADDR